MSLGSRGNRTRVTAYVSYEDVFRMDDLVRSGQYGSRSEIVTAALRSFFSVTGES